MIKGICVSHIPALVYIGGMWFGHKHALLSNTNAIDPEDNCLWTMINSICVPRILFGKSSDFSRISNSVCHSQNFQNAAKTSKPPKNAGGFSVVYPPRSSKVTESMYKYLQTRIEALKLCIIKSVKK